MIKQTPVLFANISARKAWILMKFYVVVNSYLVSLNFHEDPCTIPCARVINVEPQNQTVVRTFRTGVRSFIKFHEDPIIFCRDINKMIMSFCNR